MQKEEAGEVRHEVDFEQLKIENKQFSERFEEKNQELLKLKLSAGNTMQVLNTFKVGWKTAWDSQQVWWTWTSLPCCMCAVPLQKKLHALSVESESLDSERDQRRELQERIEAETRVVTKVWMCPEIIFGYPMCLMGVTSCVFQEKQIAEEVNVEARRKLNNYRVPDVSHLVTPQSSEGSITL